MKVTSEELPQVGELGKYDEETKKYTLVYFTISNLSEKHFRATVSQSSIYDEGTVFDFYRQE